MFIYIYIYIYIYHSETLLIPRKSEPNTNLKFYARRRKKSDEILWLSFVVSVTRSCKAVQIPIQDLDHLTLRWPGFKTDLVWPTRSHCHARSVTIWKPPLYKAWLLDTYQNKSVASILHKFPKGALFCRWPVVWTFLTPVIPWAKPCIILIQKMILWKRSA